MYTVIYTGMDRLEHEEEYDTLEEAKKACTFIEERGGHSISIEDDHGEVV